MRNNPINFTDPTGHMVAPDTRENGCSGSGPACIIDMYYAESGDSEGLYDSLEAYVRRNPDDDPTQDQALTGTAPFIVAAAKTRVGIENGSFWDYVAFGTMTGFGSWATGYAPYELATGQNGKLSRQRRDFRGDPDCVGCGYQSPSMLLKGKYAPSYVQKIQETYQTIRSQGIDITEHGINRLLGRSSRGVTTVNVVDTYYNGKLYTDPAYGTNVRFRNGVALSIDPLSGKIINVQTQTNPTARWIPVQ